jgi:hypothetical protein
MQCTLKMCRYSERASKHGMSRLERYNDVIYVDTMVIRQSTTHLAGTPVINLYFSQT